MSVPPLKSMPKLRPTVRSITTVSTEMSAENGNEKRRKRMKSKWEFSGQRRTRRTIRTP